jgi:hypothetical protein
VPPPRRSISLFSSGALEDIDKFTSDTISPGTRNHRRSGLKNKSTVPPPGGYKQDQWRQNRRHHFSTGYFMHQMTYDKPISTRVHYVWCCAEAERRYEGRLVREGEMLLVEDAEGVCHTDPVLRALSFYI